MPDTITESAPTQPADRVYHGEVVGVTAQTYKDPPEYRAQIEADGMSVYVTILEPVPLWTPYDIILKPVGEVPE